VRLTIRNDQQFEREDSIAKKGKRGQAVRQDIFGDEKSKGVAKCAIEVAIFIIGVATVLCYCFIIKLRRIK
jgi:hypothetical protein